MLSFPAALGRKQGNQHAKFASRKNALGALARSGYSTCPWSRSTCRAGPGCCDGERSCHRAHRSTESRGVGLSALRAAVASGTVRGLPPPAACARRLRGQDRHHQRRPRGHLALRRADADRSGRLGPSSLAGEAAAVSILAQGPAERPRRVPRRGPLRDELPARAGRSGSLLDLPAGIGPRRHAERHVPPVRRQRPDGLGRAELHQRRDAAPASCWSRPFTPSRTTTRSSRASRSSSCRRRKTKQELRHGRRHLRRLLPAA